MFGDFGRSEQDEKLAAERQQREREARDKELKSNLRAAFLRAGGSEQEFEKEFPTLRAEYIRRRAIDDAMAQENRAAYSSF